MAFLVSRSAQFFDKEVLKYPAPFGTPFRSIVLDATTFVQDTGKDNRTVVPAGTILKLSVTNSKRYVAFDGFGRIEGIMMRPVELLARATNANEPVNLGFMNLVFATTQIVSFTTYAANLAAATSGLTACRFE